MTASLRIHWRHRHATLERLAAVREVLEAAPGPGAVVLDLTGTGQRYKLPVTVTPSKSLCRAVHEATGQTGTAFVLDPKLLWPDA